MITCVVGCILLPRWGLSGVLTPMACLPLMIIHACLSDYIRGRTPKKKKNEKKKKKKKNT